MHNDYSRLLTTGFVLREDTPKMLVAEDFIDKHNLGFDVYRVEGIKELYSEYLSNPIHENYMSLVDVVSSVIGHLTVEEFFIKGQANNTTITPLTTCLIEDVLRGTYHKTHLKYAVATSGLKLCLLANLTNGVKLEKQFKDAWESNGKPSMVNLLSGIIAEKEVFVSFLRYVFVD
ncbi:hypothetical protein AGENTSMITH_30 [Bacillus phage vB_BspM_AgentSmith]|nr:hypothetical protein AGENTSMITH_30 [Bacillus phage vB_BspM_AgentSmith]